MRYHPSVASLRGKPDGCQELPPCGAVIGVHPTATEIEGLFLGTGVPDSGHLVVEHLLEQCAICCEAVAGVWHPAAKPRSQSPAGAVDKRLDEIFEKLPAWLREARARMSAERDKALSYLEHLLAQPLPRQLILVSNSQRYRSWCLCELLIERGWAFRFQDPRRTEELAQVAVTLASALPEQQYGTALTWDLRAKAWTALANGRRIMSDFAGARAALAQARLHLDRGSGDPLVEAGWLEILASLAKTQRRYDEAEAGVLRVIRLYRQCGDRHALGAALIKRAAICQAAGAVDRAIVFGREGIDLVDADRDASVLLGGWLNLVRALHDTGRHRDALAALGRARRAYLLSGDRTTLLRFQWLEGSIATALGREELAEGCFRETRDGFLQLGIAHDAALASLDLAGLLVRQGRNLEVWRLATEMIAIFESRESRTEALAALILLRQAAERERVTETLLDRLRVSLREVRAQS